MFGTRAKYWRPLSGMGFGSVSVQACQDSELASLARLQDFSHHTLLTGAGGPWPQ